MAVGAGESEAVSAIEFPDQQGKYRGISQERRTSPEPSHPYGARETS